MDVDFEFLPIYDGYFDNLHRYFVEYGGRGSGKSYNTAQHLVLQAMIKPSLILCTREFQSSTKESSHRILSNIINGKNLNSVFKITETSIKANMGAFASEFIFAGLKHSPDKIKSTEGITDAWLEEAENISKESMELLVNTVRLPDSKIYITFNPKNQNSHIYEKYVLNASRDNRIKPLKINWDSNPHFLNSPLNDERLQCLANESMDYYRHVWEGECLNISDLFFYSQSIHFLHQHNMITNVDYNPMYPVVTYWDIGLSDYTSIWFMQNINGRINIIDFLQNNGEHPAHYAEELNSKGYSYSVHYLPHDGEHARFGMTKKIAPQLWDAGLKGSISYTKKSRGASDIQATRGFLRRCWFDANKCDTGLKMLKNYRKKYNQDLQTYADTPVHDWASHASDAFLYLAMHNLDQVDMVSGLSPDDIFSKIHKNTNKLKAVNRGLSNY
jgi:phage terminase large subunit